MGLLEVTREGSGPPLLWLHGFTQTRDSARTFRSILAKDYEVLTVDLPGHGANARRSASLEEAADLVMASLEDEPVALGGYSLGGRVALHAALRHRERLSALVLLSATPGLADAAERSARRERDEALARRIETIGADRFLDEWLAQPLFSTLAVDEEERASRSANGPGLADSLRRAGTGNQRDLRDELRGLDVATLVLAGGRDEKFVRAAEALASSLTHARLEIVEGRGHALHLEDGTDVASRVATFLSGLSPSTR